MAFTARHNITSTLITDLIQAGDNAGNIKSILLTNVHASTSVGVAPGYTAVTLIIFKSISGNTSIFNIGIVVAPVMMIKIIKRFETTLLLTNQRINFSILISRCCKLLFGH